MSTIQVIATPKNVKDLTGKKFWRWTIRGFSHCQGGGAWWFCECECSNTKIIRGNNVTQGRSRSCGCAFRVITTHGKSKTREYQCWSGMIQRCTNKNAASAPRYLDRGIKVCQRWVESFADFLDDMGEAPTRFHSIDRIDNDGNYEPDNCRWATRTEQQRNMRGNKVIEIGGVSRCLVEWAEVAKTNYKTVSLRIKRGWNQENAIFTPIGKYQRPARPR